jgi:hypothetical protein
MNNNTIGEIGANELVFNTDKEEGVFSGGFNVNSIMMKSGLSPIMTLNTQLGGGDSNKVSDLFQSLVIPNWALTYGNKVGGEYNDQYPDNDSDIDDDLHDKLLGMVREHENKLKQQNQNNKNRKTKKQKTSVNTKKGGTRRRK